MSPSPRAVALIFAGVALMIAVACSSTDSNPGGTPPAGATLDIVTTIYPVTYFAERIGGDRVEINSLVRPGVDAHDFEPLPDDIIDLRNADVLLYTDPAFEVWVEDALASIGNSDLIVVTTANLPADGSDHGHSHDGEGVDPHVWLNPINAVEQVEKIQDAFTMADAEGTAVYAANAEVLIGELLTLDYDFATFLASCTRDTIVVSHEAYGHLAERYALNQIGLADLSAEFETTPRRVAEIVEQMDVLGIDHILQEPILSDDLANTVANETGAEILPLHPLESLTPDEVDADDTYFTVMHRNLSSLRTALDCS